MTDQEGNLLYPKVGQILEDTRLFIVQNKEGELEQGGVYDVKTQCWLIELKDGSIGYQEKNGKMLGFSIGYTIYDMTFKPSVGKCVDWFEVSEGELVKNCLDQNGNYYIGTEDEAMKSSRFLDVASGEEIILPDGYECARFMRDGYFLLSRKNEYAIYDVSTQEITRTFTIEGDAFAGTIYVLGSDGYIVQDPFGDVDGNQVVIEGKLVKMRDSATMGYLLPGGYQVVKIGTLLDTSVEKSYILNPDGQMLLETKEDVIYADEEGYLIWDVTGKYQIQRYKTQAARLA